MNFDTAASLDIAGAFDTVPHHEMVGALQSLKLGPYLARFIEKWLRARRFPVQFGCSAGQHLSASKPKTQGLPEGGVLLPFLWLLHFNGLRDEVHREVASWDDESVEVRVLDRYFADDVTLVLAHPESETLVRSSWSGD